MVFDAFDLGGPVGEGAFVRDSGGVFAFGFGEGVEGVLEFLLEGWAYHGEGYHSLRRFHRLRR